MQSFAVVGVIVYAVFFMEMEGHGENPFQPVSLLLLYVYMSFKGRKMLTDCFSYGRGSRDCSEMHSQRRRDGG